jgi:hypothetical protein
MRRGTTLSSSTTGVRRGTTPTVTLTVTNTNETDCDLTNSELYITFQEKPKSQATKPYNLTKRETDDSVSITHEGLSTIIEVTLSQEETLAFSTGSMIRVQLRCKELGVAQATDIKEFKAEEILLDGEI